MTVSILTIGDELLNGQTIDSNSAWIAQELNKIGFQVQYKLSVGDNAKDILDALEHVNKKCKYVFITGGLGPTSDDITKPTLLKYFGGEMVLNQASLELIKKRFLKLKREMIERNVQQAMLPSTCEVLLNHWGTAPAMRFAKNNTTFFSLPGVPYEMKNLFSDAILPTLIHDKNTNIIHKFILTHGLGESFIADKLEAIECELPQFIKLAYLPSQGFVKLRLTGTHNDLEMMTDKMRFFCTAISNKIYDNVISTQHENILDAVLDVLHKKNLTIATAESCTGGYLAHLLTQYAGASSYFLGSVISYSNDVKQNVLNIPSTILASEGAVSASVARLMLKNVLQKINSSVGISITGYLSESTEHAKSVTGQIFICVGNQQNEVVHEINLPSKDRRKNLEQASLQALLFLYKFINQHY